MEDSSSASEKGRTSSQPSPHAAGPPPPSPAARLPCAAGQPGQPARPPRFAILTALNLRKITFQAPSGCASNYYRFAAIKKKPPPPHTLLFCSRILQLQISNSCSSDFASSNPSAIRCCRGYFKKSARGVSGSWSPSCGFVDFSSEKLHT